MVKRWLLVVAATIVATGSLAGQSVRGTVRDSATGAPLPGVTLELRAGPTPVAAVYTDSAGGFVLRSPRAGRFAVVARKLGFDALATVEFDLAEGQERQLRLTMIRSATRLDTIIARANQTNIAKVTPGQAWFAQHVKEGKGEFISPLDILISRRNPCDYIAAIPGLTFGIESAKTTKGPLCLVNHRVITTSQRGSCLVAVLDRIGPITGIDSAFFFVRMPRGRGASATDTLSIQVPFEAIRGFEIFRNFGELPRDPSPAGWWRDTAKVEDRTRCGFLQVWTEIAW